MMRGGFAILLAAVRMLGTHRRMALGLAAAYLLLMLGADGWVRLALFGHLGTEVLTVQFGDHPHGIRGMTVWQTALMSLTALGALALVAVLWHRHVLGQGGAPLPTTRLGLGVLLMYAGWLVATGVLVWVPAIVFLLIIVAPITGNPGELGDRVFLDPVLFAMNGLFQVIVTYALLRFSLVLPAVAIGAPRSLRASLQGTRRHSRAFWLVAAVSTVVLLLPPLIAKVLTPVNPALAWMVSGVLSVVPVMLGLSILTWLYDRSRDDLDMVPD